MYRWDYLLDTNARKDPKMAAVKGIFEGLNQAVKRPFSVVPFFDPGPWGGHWMKKFCNLDPSEQNYAWCFNCVPEENSLLLRFGEDVIEIPSINLVFCKPKELKFGMNYTQDESYYMLQAVLSAQVYLGLKDGVNPDEMNRDLEVAQSGGTPFIA